MKNKPKTIRISFETWKILMQIKLDRDKQSLEELLKEFIENEGY